jgi:hypothetical protein
MTNRKTCLRSIVAQPFGLHQTPSLDLKHSHLSGLWTSLPVECGPSMKIRTHTRIRTILGLCAFCAVLTGSAHGQGGQTPPGKLAYGADRTNVPDAIEKVKSGDFAAVHVDLIARAGAVEAIPILKEEFLLVQDTLLKAKIAAALMRLGDKDDAYWNFLVELAAPTLESDAPDFIAYDSHGKASSAPSPAFVEWVKMHGVAPATAAEDSNYMLPVYVGLLAWSEDPRAIPFLRKGLLSANHMIEIMAALGLAEIGDKDSIPLIIEACSKAPADAAAAIAESLIYFDTAEAQSAVNKYIPPDIAKIYREGKAQGKNKPLSPAFMN